MKKGLTITVVKASDKSIVYRATDLDDAYKVARKLNGNSSNLPYPSDSKNCQFYVSVT